MKNTNRVKKNVGGWERGVGWVGLLWSGSISCCWVEIGLVLVLFRFSWFIYVW